VAGDASYLIQTTENTPMRSHLCLLLLLLGLATSLSAATLEKFSGTVKVMRFFKSLELKKGMELKSKDMIITGAKGSVVIRLKDKSTLNLGAETRFKLSSLKGEGSSNRKVEMDLIEGAGLFNVTSIKEEESFFIRTPTAVAGVRGTRFGVRYVKEGRRFVSSIAVIKGRVAVRPVRRFQRKSANQPKKEIELTAMTQSSVEPGGSMSEPAPLSKEDALQLAGETGLIPTESEDSSSSEGGEAAPSEDSSAETEAAVEELFEGVEAELIEPTSSSGPQVILTPTTTTSSTSTESLQEINSTVQETRKLVEENTRRIPTPPAPPSQTEAQ
jgi:hypothetical protein